MDTEIKNKKNIYIDPGNIILDTNVIEELKKMNEPGEEIFLNEIINLYLSELSILVQNILISFKYNNIKKMIEASHSLKGASLNIGAISMAELSKEIEKAGYEKNIKGIQKLLEKVEFTSRMTSDNLKKIVSN